MLRLLARLTLALSLLLWAAHTIVWIRFEGLYVVRCQGRYTLGLAIGRETWIDLARDETGYLATGEWDIVRLPAASMAHEKAIGYELSRLPPSYFMWRGHAPSWLVSAAIVLPAVFVFAIGRWRRNRASRGGFEVIATPSA